MIEFTAIECRCREYNKKFLLECGAKTIDSDLMDILDSFVNYVDNLLD